MARKTQHRKSRRQKVESIISDRLVDRGQALFDARRVPTEFTRDPKANRMLNDLDRYPHAFVLGCVMDRNIQTERAWLIPYVFSQRPGGLSMKALAKLSRRDVKRIMSRPAPLHRFVHDMSDYFYSAVQKIIHDYERDASRIWSGKPSSAEVVYRFLEFEGVGPKIASMAANLLARQFKIRFSDYYSIDISADVHVRRVFGRLGLCPTGATADQLVYKAKALHPDFPGILDKPIWEIGRAWCRPRQPLCADCYMNDVCPAAAEGL